MPEVTYSALLTVSSEVLGGLRNVWCTAIKDLQNEVQSLSSQGRARTQRRSRPAPYLLTDCVLEKQSITGDTVHHRSRAAGLSVKISHILSQNCTHIFRANSTCLSLARVHPTPYFYISQCQSHESAQENTRKIGHVYSWLSSQLENTLSTCSQSIVLKFI